MHGWQGFDFVMFTFSRHASAHKLMLNLW